MSYLDITDMRKILIVLPNYIGDVLMTTPSLRILRSCFPNAEIIVLVSKKAKDVITGNPAINNLIIREDKLSLVDRWNLVKQVRMLSPDCVLLFRSTFFYGLLAFCSKAPLRFGLRTEWAHLFLTKTVGYDRKRRFRDECLEIILLAEIGKPLTETDDDFYRMQIYPDSQDEKYIVTFLKENNLSDSNRIVVINPGTTRLAKQWQAKNYAVIIDRLMKKNFSVIITGTNNDQKIVKKILSNVAQQPIEILGKTSIKQLTVLIKKAVLFISPDTGPMYLADIVKTKSITLFGSTDPHKYGPFDKTNSRIIYKKLDCSPCYQDFCRIDKNLPPCMQKITVEDVWQEIQNMVT